MKHFPVKQRRVNYCEIIFCIPFMHACFAEARSGLAIYLESHLKDGFSFFVVVSCSFSKYVAF